MSKWIEKGSKRIYVEEYMPKRPHLKMPVIIFSHGFNGSGDDFKRECMQLMEKGIACICLDFCGGANQSRSSGKTTEMSLLTEKEDLLMVLEYAEKIQGVDREHIYLFGASQGGMVSALVAEEAKERIAGLMLLYPALCIPDDWQKQYPALSDIPESTDLWGVQLGKIYFETIHTWDVWEKIGTFSKPVMIMHGDMDEVVAPDYARKAAKLYPRAVYHEFAGEGHGFSEKGMEKLTSLVEAFVAGQRQ